MKVGDVLAVALVTLVVLMMTIWRATYDLVYAFSPALVAFVKFSVLATFGETLVSRILTGQYLRQGFGLIAKALVWGVLGLFVYAAFIIFENGATALVFGNTAPGGGVARVLWALSISVSMNLVFAPVLMTVHHLTDLFIAEHQGSFPVAKLRPAALLSSVDWRRMWSFVFARTIPLFWVPAHTITFLLPASVRLLYATGLSVALGLFMALIRRSHAPENTPVSEEGR